MYELLTGEHPVWKKGMTKEDYIMKLNSFSVEELFPHKYISPLA